MRSSTTTRPPTLWIGPPGVGKTAGAADRLRGYHGTPSSSPVHVEVLLASACVAEDIAGIPVACDGKEVRLVQPWLVRLRAAAARGVPTMLFLDELDKARRDVADTLLTLVASRHTAAGEALPADTVIEAAANPPEWGGGDGISMPMLSRFCVRAFAVDPIIVRDRVAKLGAVGAAVAAAISESEFPLVDAAGEGLDWRLTCPRTLELACMTGGTADELSGLLTPLAVSAIMRRMDQCRMAPDMRDAARRAGQRATSVRQPLRLPA